MKPVNLLPSSAAATVAAASGGKPNVGAIGGVAVGVIAVLGVAGYFAMARVDSVKSETAAAQQQATQATSQTAAVRSQIESLGKPVEDSDKQLAQGAQQVLVAAYGERHDFGRFAREVQGIMNGTGGWLLTISAESAAPDSSSNTTDAATSAITITGYMPTKELAASIDERANSQSTIENATIVGIQSERMLGIGSKGTGLYWRFVMTADIVDTVAPDASTPAGGTATSDGSGTTVSGGSSGEPKLSLSSEPPKAETAAKPAKPAQPKPAPKPRNPFDIAAGVAAGGGGS